MKNIQAVIDRIIQETKKRGATFTEVLLAQGIHSLKRVTDGEAYQPTASEGISIAISCIINGKRISADCDSETAVNQEIDNLFLKAQYLPKEKEEPFIPNVAFPQVFLPLELLYDAKTAEMDDSRLIDVICRINTVVESAGFIFDGAVAQSLNELAFANSVGTFQICKSTSAHLSIFGFDPLDRSISAYKTVAGKTLAQFQIEMFAEEVTKKLFIQREYFARHNDVRINPFGGKSGPQRFDVIMEPSCWTGLLSIFSGQAEAWNGKAYHEGTSFFSKKLGTRVMGENITICDEPLHKQGIPQAFDYEGYPKQKVTLVENGIAKNVVYDTALAKKYGTISTGHALPASVRSAGALPLHLTIKGGDSTIEQMIKDSKEPTLWITTLHYIRSTHNQDGRTTGTTLHGVFLVKNGEIIGPTENLRFDESVPEALSRVTHIGKSLPTLSTESDDTPFIIPAMRSKEFRFVSVNDRSVK